MATEITTHGSGTTALDLTPTTETGWSRELVKQIAKDVGDAVATHVEIMYPTAVAAAPSTFLLSVRNCAINEIMAAIDVNDAGQIEARLANRKLARRRLKAAYRKLREDDGGAKPT